jgi:hypothetical protein
MNRTHPRASAKLLYCEAYGGLAAPVYAVAEKRLDDLTLPKEGRKDYSAYVLEQRSSVRNECRHERPRGREEQRARVLTGS